MTLRAYQTLVVQTVDRRLGRTVRALLVVAPPAAGKTTIGVAIARKWETVLWVAHRQELVRQARDRLVGELGAAVGVVMPGVQPTPRAPVQVGTVQSLIKRGPKAPALVVLDEAHHYEADDWSALLERFPKACRLGLTATPQRGDGRPLDNFDELVVAGSYSELIRDGFLAPIAVLQPPRDLDNDLAQDPLAAWLKHSGGVSTFACFGRVSIALDYAKRFRDHGVIAETIHAGTSSREREQVLDRFKLGRTRVLTYVDTMTEGVDVPEAACILLAKNFGNVGQYLQTVGRVGRPAPGKSHGLLLDLTGASRRHGSPTMDRVYSLEGRPISGEGFGGGGPGGAPDFEQQVFDLQLKATGWQRPAAPAPVKVNPIAERERKAEYLRLRGLARAHRMRDGFASAKYREKFGESPKSEWQ